MLLLRRTKHTRQTFADGAWDHQGKNEANKTDKARRIAQKVFTRRKQMVPRVPKSADERHGMYMVEKLLCFYPTTA